MKLCSNLLELLIPLDIYATHLIEEARVTMEAGGFIGLC